MQSNRGEDRADGRCTSDKCREGVCLVVVHEISFMLQVISICTIKL